MLRRYGISRRWSLVFDAAVFGFSIIGFVQLMITLSWFDRTPPLKVHFRVIQTLGIQAGEKFEYWNFFTRTKYCDTAVTRWFVSSEGVRVDIEPLPSFMPTEALNVMQVSEARITTPRTLPPGITKSCFQSTWQCNPVQEWIWPLEGPETCLTFLIEGKPPPQAFTPITEAPWGNGFAEVDYPSDGN